MSPQVSLSKTRFKLRVIVNDQNSYFNNIDDGDSRRSRKKGKTSAIAPSYNPTTLWAEIRDLSRLIAPPPANHFVIFIAYIASTSQVLGVRGFICSNICRETVFMRTLKWSNFIKSQYLWLVLSVIIRRIRIR